MERPACDVPGQADASREGRPAVIIRAMPFAISGAVAGFFLAGHIALGAGVLGGVLLGVILGWWCRELAGGSDAQ